MPAVPRKVHFVTAITVQASGWPYRCWVDARVPSPRSVVEVPMADRGAHSLRTLSANAALPDLLWMLFVSIWRAKSDRWLVGIVAGTNKIEACYRRAQSARRSQASLT